MAAKFKKLLYFTYGGKQGATAFVGFPVEHLKYEAIFRDSLCEEIEKITGYKHRKTTGVYEEVDVNLDFFDSKDSEIINTFYSQPYPGCLAWLFRTRYYRLHKAEEEKIDPLLKIKISTSHDFMGVDISKSIFTEIELARLINKVAEDLNLQICRGPYEYSANEVIKSNRTFGANEQ